MNLVLPVGGIFSRISGRRQRNALLLLFMLVLFPLQYAVHSISNLPHKSADYDEILHHGNLTNGTVLDVRWDSNVDDGYWTVIDFAYSHDGRRFVGTIATSSNEGPPPEAGATVAVRFIGDHAILPDSPPVEFNLDTGYLFSLGFGCGLGVSMMLMMGSVMLVAAAWVVVTCAKRLLRLCASVVHS